MGARRLLWLAYGLAAILFVQIGSSYLLEPIDMFGEEEGELVTRDNDRSSLDLLDAENFFWGGLSKQGKYALGNFTAQMLGDHEHIIAMERFYHLLESIHCTDDSFTMKFADQKDYEYAARTWHWVNNHPNHTFVMVAGRGHCKWNKDRQPFIVKNVLFRDDGDCKEIKAIGKVSNWPDAIRSYELIVGGRQRPNSRKRDWDYTWSFPITADLPLSHVKVGGFHAGNIQLQYDCNNCGTRGDIDFDFVIKTKFDIPYDFQINMAPRGVSASFEPTFGLSAALTDPWIPFVELGSIPLAGVAIGNGLLDLGPRIAFYIGGALGPLRGNAQITGGGTLTVSDSGELSIDVLNPASDSAGWSATFTQKPWTVTGSISGSIKLQQDNMLLLSVSAMKEGIDAGFSLQPFIAGTISYSKSNQPICPNSQDTEALQGSVYGGVGIIGEGFYQNGNLQSPLLSATLWSMVWTLGSFCWPASGSPGPPTTTMSNSTTPSPPSSSVPSPSMLSSVPYSSFPTPFTSIFTPSSWYTYTPPPPSSPGNPPPASSGNPPPASSGNSPPASSGIPPPASSGIPPPASSGIPPPATSVVPTPPPPPVITQPSSSSLPTLPQASHLIRPFVRRRDGA